ncbi:Uncharacterized protein BM_BM9507 [Brugia malayi]|uniref:Bm9507 n=1 Tax=Brugia malayi TaxID=6279 RepID=A0A0K0JZI9_BRUMA|nr:Uncharacterized protein BM_BM9507 [Brugia malayi]CTP81154.1 Bm9507 [Brugia malayi]VIO88693.1 Uncharacterized protein BM_BM9507 [Brugia malayi]
MSIVLIALFLVAVSKNLLATCQLICTNESSGLNEKRICFDLNKGRFVDPKIGRNSIYDMEVSLKRQEISLGRTRRKPRACRGYNFYRRCQKKYATHLGRLECRYARCSVCITEHLHPGCPFCHADKSVFCPAVETCSCPWKAGYGIWDSCRRQINSRCYDINATKSKKSKTKHLKKNRFS